MDACGRRKLSRIPALVVILMLLTPCVTMAAGAAEQQPPGGVTGRVYLDENADTEFRECDCDCGMENIPVRLYRDHCGGLIIQTARTGADGYFHFDGLEPGNYCLMPMPKFICERSKRWSALQVQVQDFP